jgi:hypothetical protein
MDKINGFVGKNSLKIVMEHCALPSAFFWGGSCFFIPVNTLPVSFMPSTDYHFIFLLKEIEGAIETLGNTLCIEDGTIHIK